MLRTGNDQRPLKSLCLYFKGGSSDDGHFRHCAYSTLLDAAHRSCPPPGLESLSRAYEPGAGKGSIVTDGHLGVQIKL